ncbi:MAG TPA: DUF4241 domain-containing protein [Caulobacter sp.]|nr:DUF4241 domain-containing protein [Caulobacter sp.]
MFRALKALFAGKPPPRIAGEPDPAPPPPREPRGQVTPRPEVLTGAFEPGFVGEAGEDRYPLWTVRLGHLDLPSGRLVAADPFIVRDDDQPFDIAIEPGRYPVDLAVADAGGSGMRVALARLLLSDRPPARWAIAVLPGQDPATLRGPDIYGYGVDTGTGSFMDAGAAAWLAGQSWEVLESITEDWQARGEARGPEIGLPHGFALVEQAGGGGMVMFSSGWGDGYYATWVGYDEAGDPAAVVTDFAVITAVNIPPA